MSALKQILSKKTDKELLFYINNIDKHTDEAVQLALVELQHRNVELPENTTQNIDQEINERAIKTANDNKNKWTENIVEDINAPEYYSQTAIYIFSILFSVIFGSILLAINCKNAGKKTWPVILFAILYIALFVFVMDYFHLKTFKFNYIINGVGVLIMYELFWNRYLGTATKYRVKSLWGPIIIGAILFILFLVGIIKIYH